MKCANLKLQRRAHIRPFFSQCMFAHSLRKFSMRDWGIEQKWMSILLPLLLLYNGNLPCHQKSHYVYSSSPELLMNDTIFESVLLDSLPFFVGRRSPPLVFADPFFPLSFLVNSWFPGTLDAFFQALFLSALLLFWLCVYHGIRVQVGSRLSSLLYFKFSPMLRGLCCIFCCLSSPPG